MTKKKQTNRNNFFCNLISTYTNNRITVLFDTVTFYMIITIRLNHDLLFLIQKGNPMAFCFYISLESTVCLNTTLCNRN